MPNPKKPMLRYLLTKFRLEILLFLLVFATYSYFYNGAAWNHISRINTIFAFVEPVSSDYLSFRINRFIIDPANGINTGDWSKFGENYYSNKAPGVALIGIPFYFLIYHLEVGLSLDPLSDFITLINAYLIHLIVTVIPISIAAVFFYRILKEHCARNPWRAVMWTVILYWGTLLFPYSTQIWGHATATAFIIISLYFFLAKFERGRLYSGFFIGFAMLSEYSCGITLFTFAIYLVIQKRPNELMFLVLGGIIPGAVFMGYHKICFGSFFTLANFFNNPYFLNEEAVGNMFGTINLEVFWGLTFSRYRGLFVYMPVLLLIFPALFCSESRKLSPWVWICLGNILGFLVMNLSFNGWHGGTCVGPRYLTPSLPFYVMLLLRLPDVVWLRVSSSILFIPSFIHMFLSTAITPMIRQNVKDPLLGYYNSLQVMIVDGENLLQPYTLPIRFQSPDSAIVRQYSAFNLGNLAGLPDLWSLLPWFVIFCAIFWQIRMIAKSKIPNSVKIFDCKSTFPL